MALIPSAYLDSVVSIGLVENDKYESKATGFLVGFFSGKNKEGQQEYQTFLVTNRHVFQDQTQIFLRFNLTDGGTKIYCLPLINDKGIITWKAHTNQSIDIAAVGVNFNNLVSQEKARCTFIQEDNMAFLQTIKSVGISQGDGVFVLGFPLGLAGYKQNYVIIKGGIIARLDDEIVNQELSFLIDSNIFPGNSGGPVILKPEAIAIAGTPAVNKAYLIGVISQYIAYQDIAISIQTKQPRVVFNENSGLARVVPMDFVKETIQDLMKVELKPDTPKQVEVEDNSAQPQAECK